MQQHGNYSEKACQQACLITGPFFKLFRDSSFKHMSPFSWYMIAFCPMCLLPRKEAYAKGARAKGVPFTGSLPGDWQRFRWQAELEGISGGEKHGQHPLHWAPRVFAPLHDPLEHRQFDPHGRSPFGTRLLEGSHPGPSDCRMVQILIRDAKELAHSP